MPPSETPAAFLKENSDLEAVQLFITDPSGVPRGKTASIGELERLFADGRPVAGSILGLDITGTDVDGSGLVWDTGDADLICRPVPGTLSRAPWLARPTAQLMLSMYALDGTPAPADPRQVLARAIERVRARGLRPVLAVELEFYLLRAGQPAGSIARGEGRIEAYGLARLEELAPVFDEVYAAARLQGIPAETLMSEYAPGQFEITLTHRDDALRAVDEAILLKRLLRGVAAKHGLVATFMAKPFVDLAGSGMHLHVSLAAAGTDAGAPGDLASRNSASPNFFASDDPAGTPLMRQAIAGLKATMAESLLVFAPNGNSYRRFRSQSYAPIAASWGINNRSVSIRVPLGPPASRHLEHRIAGADANPYLAAATVLAGIEHGIVHELDPGPAVTGNGYRDPAVKRELPQTWQEAIDRAAESRFLRDALGEDFLKIFLAIKRQECDRFSAEVTELDRSWYLQST
ncbi:MAG: glutamine synthetase [Gammaproteobacteria bacterium]|nr:glutamine synthetase [Gammaproteobacteria bacterium]MBM4210198.1 glutamine synthetase [Gammaproteobacteria bacterium]MBM4231074.1 glutamine synthetase [Gammaproteobacteria bacterium]